MDEPPAPAGPAIGIISGWSGSTNLGDELLGLALVRKLQARGVTPVVISTKPQVTRRRFGVKAIGHSKWPEVVRTIARASVLITGGGDLIQDATSHLSLPYHLSRPRIAAALGTPFSGVGLGIGPLKTRTARLIARRVLKRAVTVGVRDQASADLLAGIGVGDVVVGADLALSLPLPTVAVSDRIIVSLRPPISGGFLPVARRRLSLDEDWVKAASIALDQAADTTGLTVHFVPLQTDRDDAVHRQVAARMRNPVTHAKPTLEGVLDDLAGGRVVIAMRYHAAIGALMGGRPAVLMGYAPKVERLATEVGPGFVLVGSEAPHLGDLPQALTSVLGRGDDVAEGLGQLRRREKLNDRVIDDLMDR